MAEQDNFSKEYIKETGTQTTEDVQTPETVPTVVIDTSKYASSKPKRTVLRAKIIHDKG